MPEGPRVRLERHHPNYPGGHHVGIEAAEFTVSAHYSPNDDCPVIEIYTLPGTPIDEIRVYVNDSQVFAGLDSPNVDTTDPTSVERFLAHE